MLFSVASSRPPTCAIWTKLWPSRGCHAAGPAAYYDHNGRARQLEGLNEKMERTLQEKRDRGALFEGACPQIQDSNRGGPAAGYRAPRYCAGLLPVRSGHLRRLFPRRTDQLPRHAGGTGRPGRFADLLDFGLVRSTVFSSNLLEHRYRKTDGRSFCIRVTPYSRSGSHINEVLWIFADEEVE